MDKKKLSRNRIIAIGLIIIGAIAILGLNVKKYNDRQEMIAEQTEKANELNEENVGLVEEELKKYDEELNSETSQAPTTIVNSRGLVYLQADSAYGTLIAEAFDYWNQAFGQNIFVPVPSGNYTNILFTDSKMPYSESNPVGDEIMETNTHLAFVNVPMIERKGLEKDEIVATFIQQMGYMLGLDENADLAKKDVTTTKLQDMISDKDVEQVKAVTDEAVKNQTLYPSILPYRPDYAMSGVQSFLLFDSERENLIDDDKFTSNAMRFDTLNNQIIDGMNSEDGITSGEIDEKGTEMYDAYLNILDDQYDDVVELPQAEYQKIFEEYAKETNVVTLTNTTSTLGINETPQDPNVEE